MTGTSSQHQGLRGYASSRAFGDYCIPVPLQSLALRDYCGRIGLPYVLQVNENQFPHSYLVLEGMITNLSGYRGVVMCSMHMLPARPERRWEIYRRVLAQGCELHMVIEGRVIASTQDAERVEELLLLLDRPATGE
jgi:sporadic carbohydrate cluster protein (TIGR04323 family)